MTLNLIIDPAEQVLSEGVLSNMTVGKVESEKTKVMETPFYFLCTGFFEVGAEVQILGAPKNARAGTRRIRIAVREDG
jgi:hypothetical protein